MSNQIQSSNFKNCRNCNKQFEITHDDLKFYNKVSPVIRGVKYEIPSPTLCPDCRQQRRMTFRSELHLFNRKSDLSGESTLSFYPSMADCKIYTVEEWYGDRWDVLDYGREFDFNRPFFEQFRELLREVPMMALSVKMNENSDYINCACWNKNCYLLAGANYNEDCYYGNFVNYSKDCIDNSFIDHCELCYECIDCAKCYNLRHSSNCVNCQDSYFLRSCNGCSNCFGSMNIRNKEFVFYNKQLTEQEYKEALNKLELEKRSGIEFLKIETQKYFLKFPNRWMNGEMNENATGDAVYNCRDTCSCFDVSNLWDCKYCTWFHESKNCMDCYAWGFPVELSYECMEVGDRSTNVLFSVSTYNGFNIMYCSSVQNCRNMFGCVGMRNTEYCILNKKYTKEEYEELMPKIIKYMQATKEFGEFFPFGTSMLPYNSTIAQDYFPLSKYECVKLGCRWLKEEDLENTRNSIVIPDSINDVDSSICKKVLKCKETGKPYKIIPQEYKLLKRMNIPISEKSFFERHKDRLNKRNPRKLFDRMCNKCKKAIKTTYDPARSEIVYCEECYLKEVY